MSLKEQVRRELENLDETELLQVSEYLAFLRFRLRLPSPPLFDEAKLGALYAECASEDHGLAEEGITEYNQGLLAEDR